MFLRGATGLTAGLLVACQCNRPASQLEVGSKEPVSFLRHAGGGFTLRGSYPVAEGSTVEEKAQAFLSRYGTALGLEPSQLTLLEAESEQRGAAGTAVFRVRLGELPVFGSRVHVHLSPGGEVVFVSGRLAPPRPPAATTPAVGAAQALQVLAGAWGAPPARVVAQELGVFQPSLFFSGEPTANLLAWRFEVARDSTSAFGYVDATTGMVLVQASLARTGLDRAIYSLDGGERIAADIPAAHPLLADESGARTIPEDPEAMRLLGYLGEVHRYFQSTFGWDSYDGVGSPLLAFVHYARPETNAYWDPTARVFAFSDGLVSQSVTSHEFGHAFNRGGSEEGWSDEPGAVGEALADVVAAFQTGSWLMAKADGGVVRTLWAPQDDEPPRPLVYAERRQLEPDAGRDEGNDFGHVHHNSSVVSFALVLWTDGGKHPTTGVQVLPVRKERAEQVLFRGVRWGYVKGNATFSQVREGLLAACLDLAQGRAPAPPVALEVEHCGALLNAFAAMGVGETDLDNDTRVDSQDGCPTVFNPDALDANHDGREDACEGSVDAGQVPDAGPGYAFAPCQPRFATDAWGSWPLRFGTREPAPFGPRLQRISCEYTAPAGAPTSSVTFYAFVADANTAPDALFSCWASTRPNPPYLCSATRQAAAAGVFPLGAPAGFEAAALGRHAAALLAAVELEAVGCPARTQPTCGQALVACPATVVLPSVTMKVHPATQQCPAAQANGTLLGRCDYVAPGCAPNQVNPADLSNAPFRPYAPRFNVVWALRSDAGMGTVLGAAPCTGARRVANDAGTVVLLSTTRKAWVSYVPGEEPVGDRAAAEQAAQGLLVHAESRAAPCP